jgi:hypothetical protein
MRGITAALMSIVVLGACTKRGGGIGVGVGLGMAAGGGIIASNPGGEPQNAMGNAMIGATLAGVGGVVLLGSLIGLSIGSWQREHANAKSDSEQGAAAESLAEPARVAPARDDARSLTKRALDEAGSGNCTSVGELAVVVRDIDPDWHATVFVRQPALAKCLVAVGFGRRPGSP